MSDRTMGSAVLFATVTGGIIAIAIWSDWDIFLLIPFITISLIGTLAVNQVHSNIK